MINKAIVSIAAAIVALPWLATNASADTSMFGGTPARNMASAAQNLPTSWDPQTGTNIKWVQALGSQTYGSPVLAGGRIFVGTNNEGLRNPALPGDRGNLMAFDAVSGQFLWQSAHAKDREGRIFDWPLAGVLSAPSVEGDRLWYVSNRHELIAADTDGFLDGVNDGPYTGEPFTGADEDIIWKLDMIAELDVFPHAKAGGLASSPLVVGDLVFVITGNGVQESGFTVINPYAPSFIAVNKSTGKLVWESALPGANILNGQWSSPAYGVIAGKPQLIFAGGDGWLYSLEPLTGQLIWKFDMNPKDSVWRLGGAGTRNNILSTPVIYQNRVYLGVGQDPENGEAPGHFLVIDGTGTGDITAGNHVIWRRAGEDFGQTVSTAAIADGIVYIADLAGFLYALDAETGQHYWTYDSFAAVWGSPLVADGKVYLGDEDGDLVVLKAGKKMQELAEINMGAAIYTTPVASDGVLYIATRTQLYAIGQ